MEFKHPKYNKELRTRNKLDQAISDEASTEATSVRPGPGLKPQGPSSKPQATKTQAASNKLLDNFPLIKFYVSRSEVLD